MKSIDVDESRLPLLMVTFRGNSTNEEFEEYLRLLDVNLDRRQATAVVVDSRHATLIPAAQRRRQAEWLETRKSDMRRYLKGTAFVIENPLIRGGLTAIFWLSRLDTPYVVFGTLRAAENWASEQLRMATAFESRV